MKKPNLFYLLTLLCLFTVNCLWGQLDGNTKAKLYFVEAESRFNQNDFEAAIEYINKTEATLGETNGRILNLKVKALYNFGKFEKAMEALEQFEIHASNVTEELQNDTYSYFVKIERAIEKTKKERIERENRLRNCTHCKGSGFYNEQLACSTCNGKGKTSRNCTKNCGDGYLTNTVICDRCHGETIVWNRRFGKYDTCPRCRGFKYIKKGEKRCPKKCSAGKVYKRCYKCKGSGKTEMKRVECKKHLED